MSVRKDSPLSAEVIEQSFAFEIWHMSRRMIRVGVWTAPVDVRSIDAYLAQDGWDQDSRARLLEERELAFAAYKAGEFDLALAMMTSLQRACEASSLRTHAHRFAKRDAAASEAQSKRRKGKPAGDSQDSNRDDRLRAYHARLVANGDDDATSQTAAAFDLSTRQVRRIVSALE